MHDNSAGYCYSTKMTYHAYVGATEEDVHPELPDRIVGIHQRLQGQPPVPFASNGIYRL